ncbi:MAG: pyridoxamine 5'-phosphate oxidase family protein [Candidatus Omnitrophica bacterium]|nr:pyridoxamine 5'-phosphate oxidase family protein [Candidatus Omnitrophota bacterium]
MDQKKVLANIRKLFDTQKQGVLATIGTPYPYTSLMTFAATPDLKQVVFATLRKTKKYVNMKANDHVSLLVDSALNRVEDVKNAVAVTMLGAATEADATTQKEFRTMLLKKNPELAGFLNETECAVMVLRVDLYIYVDSFQHVIEIAM